MQPYTRMCPSPRIHAQDMGLKWPQAPVIFQDKKRHYGTSTYTACLLVDHSPILPTLWTFSAAASVVRCGAGLCNALTFRISDTGQDRQEMTVTQLQAPNTVSEA